VTRIRSASRTSTGHRAPPRGSALGEARAVGRSACPAIRALRRAAPGADAEARRHELDGAVGAA
jgi:hypothetical protein